MLEHHQGSRQQVRLDVSGGDVPLKEGPREADIVGHPVESEHVPCLLDQL